MFEKDKAPIIVKIILAFLFILCLWDMPYGFYQLVRFLGLVGFAILSYHSFKQGENGYALIWIASTVLVNPIFKISLGREIWGIIDVVWALVLIVSIFHKGQTIK